MSTTGSCLCGDIRWECNPDPESGMRHCHCSICRKVHGSPFATFLWVEASDFRWLAGEEALARYRATPDSVYERTFCPRCGSAGPVPVAGRVYMPAGCLDGDPGARPDHHIFTGSQHNPAVVSDHRWSGAGRELPGRLAAAAGGRTAGAARRPGGRHRRQLSLRGGRVSHHRAFPEDPQLPLPSLSEGSIGGPRDQRYRALARAHLRRGRGQSRVVQGARRRGLQAGVLPHLRLTHARGLPRTRSVLRVARCAGHPSGAGSGRQHLRRLPRAVVRDHGRARLLRRGPTWRLPVRPRRT